MNKQSIYSQVSHDVFCVLYVRETGQIAFVHRVTTLGGAQKPSDQEVEEQARTLMQMTIEQFGNPVNDNIGVLMVAPDALRPGRSYVVDISTGNLVEQSSTQPKTQ